MGVDMCTFFCCEPINRIETTPINMLDGFLPLLPFDPEKLYLSFLKTRILGIFKMEVELFSGS